MLKKILFSFTVFTILAACNSKKVKIEGSIDNSISKLYLFKHGEQIPFDSISVEKGLFSYSTEAKNADMAMISNTNMPNPQDPNLFLQYFILEPGTIEMKFDIVKPENNSIKGKLNTPFQNIMNQIKAMYKHPAMMLAMQGDTSQMVLLDKMQDSIQKNIRKSFFENTSNVLSLTLLSMVQPDSQLIWFPKIDTAVVNNTNIGKSLKGIMEQLAKQNSTPKTTPNVSLLSLNGSTVSFADLKGKYVLVDFWAYWCKPCRQLNSEIKKMYNLYKNKVEFVSISIDPDMAKWYEAVAKDGLTWAQWTVGEDESKAKILAEHYGISGIPHTIFIGPDGATIKNGMHVPKEIEAIIKKTLNI